MRKLFLPIIISVLFPLLSFGSSRLDQIYLVDTLLNNGISVIVDERFELVSVAFRLAEAEEYHCNTNPRYLSQIDEYFSPYKNHNLIKYIKDIRESYNFAYSIAAKSALMIELKDGHVRINPDWDLQLEFTEEYDSCWNKQIFYQYISLLDSFYRTCKFHSFFVSQRSYYQNAIRACVEMPSLVNIDWFEDFFGDSSVGVDLILGLCIGKSNYSIHDVRRKINWNRRLSIMIGTEEDPWGIPSLSLLHLPEIIHEISHYYSSPIVKQYYSDMEISMTFLFSKVRDCMERIGYGNVEDTTGEWINELFVNCYLSENSEILGTNAFNVARDVESGFLWMERANAFMSNFYNDRESYPTIKEFMPQLVAFTNCLPNKWETIEFEYNNRSPYVVDLYPAGGVFSSTTKEIRVTFSMPMMVGIHGANSIPGYTSFPCNISSYRWVDSQTFVIGLDGSAIIPGNKYGIKLLSHAFISTRYYRMKDDYEIVLIAE